jgi:hypothetical protein
MRISRIAIVFALVLGWLAQAVPTIAATADPAAKPDDPVILTVSGAIGQANRGPTDPFRDRLFAFHEISFDRAMAFTRADLAALGLHALTVSYPKWKAPHRFEGPLLRDVLARAGVKGGVLHPLGLDGYSADIPFADLARYDAILALKMDGQWLATGGVGPAWIMYPYKESDPALRAEGDTKWVWGVFHIRADPR